MDTEQEKSTPSARKKGVELSLPMAAGILAVVLTMAGTGGYLLSATGSDPRPLPTTAATTKQETASEPAEKPLESAHEHAWEPVLELRDVPAVTHLEHHDAIIGTQISYETVCNMCNAIVTGATGEHTNATGHPSFTRNVPIENELVERAAWDETVIDEPATVELVHTADRCSGCGITRDIDDEPVETSTDEEQQ